MDHKAAPPRSSPAAPSVKGPGHGSGRGSGRPLPSALEAFDEVLEALSGGTPSLFLDFDGTLAPIVPHPDDAAFVPGLRGLIARIAQQWPVAVVSGRAVHDVKQKVGVDDVAIAGDHGMVWLVDGEKRPVKVVKKDHLDALQRLGERIDPLLRRIEGAWCEKKDCTLSVHTRRVREDRKKEVEHVVDQCLNDVDVRGVLEKTYGKEVIELKPRVDWDKGRAVVALMEMYALKKGQGSPLKPVVIGDDVTDEAAFRAVEGDGVSIFVGPKDASTAAMFRLRDPDQVHRFLGRLWGENRSGHGPFSGGDSDRGSSNGEGGR